MFMLWCVAFLTSVLAIEFEFTVNPKGNQCFGDRLGENTLVVGSVLGNASHFQTKIHVI
jgi:hypothetical protein